MMSANMSTPGLLKIYVNGIANKILSRVSNYIVALIMRPKFINSSIPMRKVIRISIL